MAVLAVGLTVAALIYALAPNDEGMDAAREIARGRMYQHNLELMGGKAGVLMAEFNEWFASLWHGRPLAYTVGALAIAIAFGCFAAAHLASTPTHARDRDGCGRVPNVRGDRG
jgi:peptidoglycan/LPS O-acetylase OafA/YrhL